jgi:hypothetical protein
MELAATRASIVPMKVDVKAGQQNRQKTKDTAASG